MKLDIFVLPSIVEPFGLVILEAQACEVPVVATNVGGIPEIVSGGETGILVETKDAGELADAILRLLNNTSKMTEMGKMGLPSGTANHLIIRAADGCLENWPIVEGSFTPTPMEPRASVQPLRSIEVVPFKSLLREALPGAAAGTRRAAGGGRVGRGSSGLFSYRKSNNRNRKGAGTMTIEELMEKLRALVATSVANSALDNLDRGLDEEHAHEENQTQGQRCMSFGEVCG